MNDRQIQIGGWHRTGGRDRADGDSAGIDLNRRNHGRFGTERNDEVDEGGNDDADDEEAVSYIFPGIVAS